MYVYVCMYVYVVWSISPRHLVNAFSCSASHLEDSIWLPSKRERATRQLAFGTTLAQSSRYLLSHIPFGSGSENYKSIRSMIQTEFYEYCFNI